MTKRIGFIGLGLMGHGMAKNLVEKGFPLCVLGHRNRAPIEDLVKRGAKEAKDVAELVRASDVVILCVTGSPQVEDLVYRAGGILESARSGQIVVDTSTSQPASTVKIAADFEPTGARFVDAPLTRGPPEAEQGRLNSMVGGDAATFEAIKPILQAYSENIFHVGEVSAGNKLKLVNNCATIGMMGVVAESLVACTKWGVDPKALFQLMSLGQANSPMFQKLAGSAIEGDFKPLKFALVNAAKDVRYYNQHALDTGLSAPIAAATMQTMLNAINLGFGTSDDLVGSLVPAQAKLNNVQFPPRK